MKGMFNSMMRSRKGEFVLKENLSKRIIFLKKNLSKTKLLLFFKKKLSTNQHGEPGGDEKWSIFWGLRTQN